MKEYRILIEGDEQYVTNSKSQARAHYELIDETFEPDCHGLLKQLIETTPDDPDGTVIDQAIINCPYYHRNDPDFPENCEYPDAPPCNELLNSKE